MGRSARFSDTYCQDGTMNRRCIACLCLLLALATTGCCYRPGFYDPQSGLAYGGGWEPCCGGPFDPFGFWCMVNYSHYGYGGYGWNGAYGYGAGMSVQPPAMYGTPAVGSPACCNHCQHSCSTGACETVVPYDAGSGLPAYSEPVSTPPTYAEPTFVQPMTTMPGTIMPGTITPVPESTPVQTVPPQTVPQQSVPQQSAPQPTVPQTSNGAAATYVYPPPSQPSSSIIPGTAQQPAVQAY